MAKKKLQPIPAVAAIPSGKKRVPYIVKVDGAREVVLTGEFTGWAKDKVRLSPAGPGEWGAQLELPPGEYQYRLIVDGQWRDDPKVSKKVPNPFGTHNGVLIVA
jgi:1,4-alpha-glucan branching enzyme